MNPGDKFEVVVDGVLQNAELLNVVTINEKDYAVYYIDNGNENFDIMASEITSNDDGSYKLSDVNDDNVRRKIINFVNKSLNQVKKLTKY